MYVLQLYSFLKTAKSLLFSFKICKTYFHAPTDASFAVYKPVILSALGLVGSKFAKCVQLCARNGSMSDGFWSMRSAAISMIVLLNQLDYTCRLLTRYAAL
jgi:hypothetical protein